MGRVVCWFSAGAASAVATKLAIADHGDVTVATIDVGSEHEDNVRFRDECAAWFGRPIEVLKSERYADTWQVWSERRFLVGPSGALCTAELKKKPRFAFERPDDVQVFGYTAEEANRADRFREQNPGVTLSTPLIDRGLTKDDTLAIVERAGIELPAMYRLGYRNNNCIGCVKGGMGYWNKIRDDFPDVFDRMAKLERDLGRSIFREDVVVGSETVLEPVDGFWHDDCDDELVETTVSVTERRPLFLDELDPERGDYPTEASHDCSLMCALAETELEATS